MTQPSQSREKQLKGARPPARSSSGGRSNRRGGAPNLPGPPAKRNWRRYRRWLIFIPTLPIVALFLLYASVVYGFTPPAQLMQGTEGLDVLDRNGQTLFAFGDQPGSGRVLPLSDISPDLLNATIAAEDANYWKNPGGLSIKGLTRAVYENLAFWENGGFFHGSGGSSITQQLAKNLYIKPEDRYKRSPVRKIKETLYAFELDRRYSKQQILEWYLANAYYGNGAYGVDSAAHRYFNKPAKELTLPEAALLAGLPQAPAYYDPFNNFEAALSRQKQVLGLMARHKLLSPAQLNEALAKSVAVKEGKDPAATARTSELAPHFAAYVRELLPSLLDKSKLKGRLKVTTTIDLSLQAKAESVVKSQLDKAEKAYGATNGALVAMDPKTGEILAMVGSHDFAREDISGQVNNALALNEPGSTMKPVTYLAAMLKGWSPATIVVDEPYKVSNGDAPYTLGNADNKYRGAVPVRTALGSSLNVPAVKTLEYAGLQQVYALAKRMGVSSLRDISNYGPAFTLGGVDVDLLDMTFVYSVFAGQGEQSGMTTLLDSSKDSRPMDPIAVLKVETPDGKLLWKPKPGKERIVPAAAAYLITNVLADDSARVSMFGANSSLNLTGRPAAVKTGASDNTRDLWAIGYTPQLVAGVWVGNANNKAMTGTSSLVAAPIWNAFMTEALKGKPVLDFEVPTGVEFANVCATTGLAPTNNCSRVVREVFLSGRVPSGVKPQAAAASPTIAPKKKDEKEKQPERSQPTLAPQPTQIPTLALPTQIPFPMPPPTNTPFIPPTSSPTQRPVFTPTQPPVNGIHNLPNNTATPVPTAVTTPRSSQ